MKRLIINDLIAWKKSKQRKPLLLTGVRQAGKTYILREFGAKYFPNYHYVNFEKELHLSKIFDEGLQPKHVVENLSFYLDCPIDIEKDLIIFDEIQACPQALTSLKYFQEDLPNLHICGAGSLLGVHLAPISFPVGKVSMLKLYPMSFEEFLIANEDHKSLKVLKSLEIPEVAHQHLWNQLKRYFVVGGMPEAVMTYIENKTHLYEAFSLVREKQEALLAAYYADIAKHSGKINAMHIDRVLKSVPMQLEKELDGSLSKFKFKGVVPGVSHYQRLVGAIDWLIAAGLVVKINIVNSGLLPFKAHAKENAFKLLLFDIGMLGSMTGLPPKVIMDQDYGGYKGYFAENFVAQEFLSSKVQKDLFSWSEKMSEVEFLAEIDGDVTPIEVKAGTITRAKSLKIFSDKYTPKCQIIMSARSLQIDRSNGKYLLPLYLAGFLQRSISPPQKK